MVPAISSWIPSTGGYARAVLIAAILSGAVVALGLFTWRLSHVLLVIFAAILVAVLLDGVTRLLRRYLPLGHTAALILVLLLITSLIALFFIFAGPAIGDQVGQLVEQLPQSAAQLRDTLASQPWAQALMRSAPNAEEMVTRAGDLLGQITGVFSSTLGAAVNAAIVVMIGVYLAWEPRVYGRSLMALMPTRAGPRAEQVLDAVGHALRWWLVGRFASMTVVGILTGIGLWIIDMPLVATLALIAGLLSFVPLIGPIASVVPALLLALMEDPLQAVYVLVVYSIVQFLESNFITPLIQRRAVSLPPAVLLAAQLLLGVLFGTIGVLLATPMAVVSIVLVQMLYIQDLLGRDVEVLGQDKA